MTLSGGTAATESAGLLAWTAMATTVLLPLMVRASASLAVAAVG